MKRNIWLDGIMGVVVGDALGTPVQFMYRHEILNRKQGLVTGMEEDDMPVGTWSDDSSMTLALLDSLRENKTYNPKDVMDKFVLWYEDAFYTPDEYTFDEGNTCSTAIENYIKDFNPNSCGVCGEHANGNGALMRILPICLYAYKKNGNINDIHHCCALTHNHLRNKMACELYYYIICEVIRKEKSLINCLQNAVNCFYNKYEDVEEVKYFDRLRDISDFRKLNDTQIKSSGYVIDSIEAAIYCVSNTNNFKDCLLKAVNLGDDTDTIAAIAGGISGIYYGYDNIPKEWLSVIIRRRWIEDMCNEIDCIY